ncbi:uncharacterized protein LOC132556750 [Ylistrum balloti]|uniref:uncharacterized protein LOC132556750 n=1 Tax=Ylistrum balloti TaxID=509963 RepID=UPI0029059E32|nr:uncharacterized protein LOC132556750 [Ylistrum balloti]
MGNIHSEKWKLLPIALTIYLLPWKTDASTCSSPAIEAYSDLGILCYWLQNDPKPADNASASCSLQGGYLAEIPDTTVFNTLTSQLSVNYPGLAVGEMLHLGYLMKTATNIEAKRPPYEVPSVTWWAASEPSVITAIDKCVAMNNTDGQWFVVPCSDSKRSLCFMISAPDCPQLDAPTNGSVSYSSTNATAIFQCDVGFTLSSGDDKLICSGTTWIGTQPTCTVAQCHFNMTEMATLHMYVDSEFADHLTNVTMKCDLGYAFFINSTSLEVVTNVTCQCVQDNGTTVCAHYDTFYNGRCDIVTCPLLTTADNSFTNLVEGHVYTYGESVTFNCTAGHVLNIDILSWPPQMTTVCTEFGQWSIASPFKCSKSRRYVGCYAAGALQVVTDIPLTGQLYCMNDCQDLDFRYAVTANGSCFCGNYIDPTVIQVDAMQCNMTCPLIPDEAHHAYCGGENSQESVYQTVINACYKELNTVGISNFSVSGDKELTCQQRCLAENVFYAILSEDICACTNTSNLQGLALTNQCENAAYNGTVHSIEHMAELSAEYEKCESLYEAGVKDNGYYNLKTLGRTYCSFKDGTICPPGWIGYMGDCYSFTKGNFTFVNAVKYCQQQDATVASLLTAQQNAFAASTIADRLSCLHDENGLNDTVWNSTLKDMTLSMCMQTCLARGWSYSIARNETCYCATDLPSNSSTAFSHCDFGCPGNSLQMCGGTESTYYTAAKVLNATRASTCEDLQSQGLTGDIFKLSGNENSTHCPNTGCPYAWVKGNSSCYKLMLGRKTYSNAIAYCANYSSHLLVFDNLEEDAFISEVLGNLTFFSSSQNWAFGLKMTGRYTNQFFWANGQRNSPIIKNVTSAEKLTKGFFKAPVMEWHMGGSINERSYICEQSEVYAGCYVHSNNSVTVIEEDFYLSVQQCVESCRGIGYDYAMLQESRCYCDETLALDKYDAGCLEMCHLVQPCGSKSNDAVSVYKTYNTSCPTTDWIGYRNNCYMFVDRGKSQDDLYTHCASLGAHLLTINDEAEHNFLRMVIKGHPKYAHTQIRIGLVNEFAIGIPTWATGSLPSYFPYPYPSPSLTSIVMERTSMSDYGYSMIDAATNIYGFCELDKQHMGCFDIPSNIQPIMSKYHNMELTQCKQICMGNVSLEGFALINQEACYCTESLFGLMLKNESSCHVTCPGNSLQVCGDGVVNAYKLAKEDIASNCSALQMAGLWKKGTYRIGDSNESCSENLFDDTECSTGWHGKDGTCYKFASLEGMAYKDAETTCFQNGGYLFYPRSPETRQMFMEILPYIYKNTTGFWTSVKDELMNSYLRGGDGWIYFNGSVVNENIYTVFNMTTGSFDNHANGSFAVICEKSAGYVGCKQISVLSSPILSPYNRNDMTATQCIQYCMANNSAEYSIIQHTECGCYASVTVLLSANTTCGSCLGYSAQPCGSYSSSSFSIFKLSHYRSNLVSSCMELFNSGIWMYGIFNIQPKDNDPILVYCFKEVFSIIIVPENLITASSYQPLHVPASSRGPLLQAVFSPDSVWIPAESGDPNPWLQIDLTNDYLVTGIFTQGRPDPNSEQWSSAFEVKYVSTVDASWKSIGSFPGNNDKASTISIFFPSPFVTKMVRVYPSGADIALRLAVIGTLMSNVDYASTNMGCYAVFNTTSSTEVQRYPSVLSDDECKTACNVTVPFYSYNVNCNAPNGVQNSVNKTTFAHVQGVFTVSSTVQFTCEEGHEFYLDNTTTRNVTCGDDYAWHGDLGDHCTIISCPDFTFPNGTISTTNRIYNTEVVLTCNTGFALVGSSTQDTIKCQADKAWNSTIPVCEVIDCGTPPAIVNTVLTDGLHTYGANVTYTCFQYMHFFSDVYNLTSQCRHDGQWELIASECTLYMCRDPPTLEQATIERINTSIATYTCPKYHHFPDGSTIKTITCNESFVWETTTECTYNDTGVILKEALITFIDSKLRQTSSTLIESVRSDSTIECGDLCLRNMYCEAFNHNKELTDTVNCKLFSKLIPSDSFLTSVDWQYFQVYDLAYFP